MSGSIGEQPAASAICPKLCRHLLRRFTGPTPGVRAGDLHHPDYSSTEVSRCFNAMLRCRLLVAVAARDAGGERYRGYLVATTALGHGVLKSMGDRYRI